MFERPRPPQGRWRRRFFWGWIAAIVVFAVYAGLAAPFAAYFGGEGAASALVPAVVILLLGLLIAWLVLLVAKPRERTGQEPHSREP